MCFVDDDQVEVANAEAPLLVPCLVDETHHGRIRRDEDATFTVFLCDQVHWRRVG
jgi:hypothetical protein